MEYNNKIWYINTTIVRFKGPSHKSLYNTDINYNSAELHWFPQHAVVGHLPDTTRIIFPLDTLH